MTARYVNPIQSIYDNQGLPIVGAKLYFFETGTLNPVVSYSDAELTIPNTIPVVADSAGRFGDVFLGVGTLKVIIDDADDVNVFTADDYQIGAVQEYRFLGTAVNTIPAPNTYNATIEPGIVSYKYGQFFTVVFSATNTGSATLNINGLGDQLMKKQVGGTTSPLSAGFITPGAIYQIFVNELLEMILLVSSTIQIGDNKLSNLAADHDGWLKMENGRTISRTTFSDLFAVIGTTYGVGDGVTTFGIGIQEGTALGVSGQGTYGGATNRNPGVFTGSETHTLTTSQIPSHDHPWGNDGDSFGVANGGSSLEVSTSGTNGRTNFTGGGGSHTNMQPTQYLKNLFIFAG